MNIRLRAILLASATVFAAAPAFAADFTVAAGQTDTVRKMISGADTLTVNGPNTTATPNLTAGVLTTATNNPTVTLDLNADTAVVVTNNGSITNTHATNRAIDSSKTDGIQRTVTINNNAGALIQSGDDAVRLQTNGGAVTGTVTINNAGTIKTLNGGQAIDLDTLTGATITINNNAGGLIEGGGNDGMRPGQGTVVNNSGTIRSVIASGGSYGSFDGVDLQGHSATINNNAGGVITGVRHGITSDVGLTVNNAAGATITGQNGSGVGSDGAGTVVNYGRISGAFSGLSLDLANNNVPTGDGDGVDIDLIGQIENYGVIEGLGAGGVKDGSPNGAEGIAMGGGVINNYAGALISSVSTAILVDDGNGNAGVGATTITNAGSITGLGGNGIVLVGNFNDTITNSGIISASGANKAIDFGAGDDTLNLSTGSTITGLVDGGAGTDTLNLSGTGTQGATANFEVLAVAANASWSLTGAQNFASATIGAGARLSGLSNVGTLTVTGAIAPGNSIGTTAVSGALTFSPTAPTNVTYEVEINAAGASDLITVGGVATLAGRISVLGATGVVYSNVTSYSILTAGSISGTFSGVTSSLAFLTPELTYSPTVVTLTLRRNDVRFGDIGLTPNQVSVGTAVSAAGITSPLYLAVLPLTAVGARTAFDALSGDIHGATRGAMLEDQRHLRNGVIGQLAQGQAGVWGDVYTADAKIDAASGYAQGDEGRTGFTVGGDRALGDWRFGLAASYGQNSVDLTGRGATADVKGGELAVYGGSTLGPIGLRFGASIGQQSIDTARTINTAGLSQTLVGSYDASTSQLFGEIGWAGQLASIVTEPFISAAWESLDTDAFAETGGSTAVSAASRNANTTYLTAGIRFSGKTAWSGAAITPRLSLAMRHSSNVNDAAAADLRFAAGPVFRVGGPLRDANVGLVEAGIDGKLGESARFSLVYAGQFSDSLTDHGGKASLYWKF